MLLWRLAHEMNGGRERFRSSIYHLDMAAQAKPSASDLCSQVTTCLSDCLRHCSGGVGELASLFIRNYPTAVMQVEYLKYHREALRFYMNDVAKLYCLRGGT